MATSLCIWQQSLMTGALFVDGSLEEETYRGNLSFLFKAVQNPNPNTGTSYLKCIPETIDETVWEMVQPLRWWKQEANCLLDS